MLGMGQGSRRHSWEQREKVGVTLQRNGGTGLRGSSASCRNVCFFYRPLWASGGKEEDGVLFKSCRDMRGKGGRLFCACFGFFGFGFFFPLQDNSFTIAKSAVCSGKNGEEGRMSRLPLDRPVSLLTERVMAEWELFPIFSRLWYTGSHKRSMRCITVCISSTVTQSMGVYCSCKWGKKYIF